MDEQHGKIAGGLDKPHQSLSYHPWSESPERNKSPQTVSQAGGCESPPLQPGVSHNYHPPLPWCRCPVQVCPTAVPPQAELSPLCVVPGHWTVLLLQVSGWKKSRPPPARSHRPLAFTIVGISLCHLIKHSPWLLLFMCNWGLKMSCLQSFYEVPVNSFFLLSLVLHSLLTSSYSCSVKGISNQHTPPTGKTTFLNLSKKHRTLPDWGGSILSREVALREVSDVPGLLLLFVLGTMPCVASLLLLHSSLYTWHSLNFPSDKPHVPRSTSYYIWLSFFTCLINGLIHLLHVSLLPAFNSSITLLLVNSSRFMWACQDVFMMRRSITTPKSYWKFQKNSIDPHLGVHTFKNC